MKSEEALLKRVIEEVSRCDRCGSCLPVCPLFGARDRELSSARGKNALARALVEGGIEPARDVLAMVDFCLLCRSCTEACPSGIRTDEVMIDLRQYLVNRTGEGDITHTVMTGILRHLPLVKLGALSLSLMRHLRLGRFLPWDLAPEEFTKRRFLSVFAGPARVSGALAAADRRVDRSLRIAYFQGCGMRLLFPRVAARTKEVLASTGPLILKDNVCCGLPHLAHGKREDFLALARRNIVLYEEVDVLVSDCASCSGMLKRYASYLDEDPLWRDRALAFSQKARDLAEYLVMVDYQPKRLPDLTVTYHDPCHLVRGQNIVREPRRLLQGAGDFVELKEAGTCCGGAGMFHLDYPEIAARILAKKRENIEATGADIVVSACPGCLVQLSRAARDSGGKFQAVHLSQVI